MKRLTFLLSYVSEWKGKLLFALTALTFVSATSLVFPWLLKLMVDQFSTMMASTLSVPSIAFYLVILFSFSTVFGYYQQLTMHALGYRLRNALRVDLYQKLLTQPLKFHRDHQVGELSARATEDIGKLQPIFASLISPIYQNALIICGGLVLTALLNWAATLVMTFFMIVPIPFAMRYSKRIRQLAARSQADHASANAFFEETLVAIRDVKAFVREGAELSRYARFLSQAFKTEISASKLVIKGNQAAYFLLSVMLLTMYYLGSSGDPFPGWTLGSMVAVFFYAYTMAMAFLSIGRIYLTYQGVTGALERIMELLSAEKEMSISTQPALQHKIHGKVEFQNVYFGYKPEKDVLRNVSFTVYPGTWVVIGGPSGSGKSTIANLLMRFYEPNSGNVCIDGIPLSQLDMTSARSQIGYVGQDPMLFHGTLKENLLLTKTEIADSALQKAIEVSCLSHVLSELPDGLHTVVGERGLTLSGGQKARVAIARALLVDPAILILDEANAMLEDDLEALLWKNLAGARAGRTTIVLTHHNKHIPRIYHYLRIDRGAVLDIGAEAGTMANFDDGEKVHVSSLR